MTRVSVRLVPAGHQDFVTAGDRRVAVRATGGECGQDGWGCMCVHMQVPIWPFPCGRFPFGRFPFGRFPFGRFPSGRSHAAIPMWRYLVSYVAVSS